MHVSISLTTSLVTSFIQVKLMAHREYHIEINLFSNDKIDTLNTIVFISKDYWASSGSTNKSYLDSLLLTVGIYMQEFF